MTAKPRPVPPSKDDTTASCGACPDFDNNLCHALTQAAAAHALPGSELHDHFVPARRTIWREGETIDRIPVICQGWASAAVNLSDGRRQILSFLLPGDIVSAVLLHETVSKGAIETITDVRYRTFPRDDIKAALVAQSDLMSTVSRVWNEETLRADRLAIDLGRRGATERIANLILTLAERLLRRGMMQEQTMDFPLRQHHIADACGLTVVHVGNVLSEFRRTRLIEINDRSLTILDSAALRRVSDAA
jgi:CRP/FNR family transcriptional regulator